MKDCGVRAQEKVFFIPTWFAVLSYVFYPLLVFQWVSVVRCLVLVVGCWCWLTVVSVSGSCLLCLCSSNGNDIETKAERSFDLGFVFYMEAKQTCLFQNL